MTQIANGTATSSFAYDNNGNLTSAGTSTFSWDYNNRMTQAVTQGSTSTYSYDYAGNRVSQTVGSTTTIYPNKFYSITSTTNGTTTYATTTQYIYNGDQLITELDQTYTNGATSSVQKIRYIHPDHLGSTNIATDDVGNVVQTLEYYPYGEIRLNQRTGMYNEQHKYIGQYADSTGLDYLNARYLNSQQGQFLSEDPVFLGDPSQQTLTDPQSLNSYSSANDNPITKSDPSGRCPLCIAALAFLGTIVVGKPRVNSSLFLKCMEFLIERHVAIHIRRFGSLSVSPEMTLGFQMNETWNRERVSRSVSRA